jgi:hypothetical protein
MGDLQIQWSNASSGRANGNPVRGWQAAAGRSNAVHGNVQGLVILTKCEFRIP